jgi:hypothetical protein
MRVDVVLGPRQVLQIRGSALSAKKEKRFRSNMRQDVADAIGLPQRDVLITKLSAVSMTVRAAPRVCAQRDGSLWRSGGEGGGGGGRRLTPLSGVSAARAGRDLHHGGEAGAAQTGHDRRAHGAAAAVRLHRYP